MAQQISLGQNNEIVFTPLVSATTSSSASSMNLAEPIMPATPVAAQIRIQNLSLSYPLEGRTVDILRQVHLEVAPGQRVAITGPSGSGKTSLLLLLAGLESPTGGQIQVDEQVITTMGRDALADWRRSQVGIIFQSFHLLPSLTALENVALPLQMLASSDALDRAKQALADVGLQERAHHRPGLMSGGEQQRVAIARALVHRPRLLLADEPTGNLDAQNGQRVEDLLFALSQAMGTTLILITHDPALAARCDRVLRVQGGQLVEAV